MRKFLKYLIIMILIAIAARILLGIIYHKDLQPGTFSAEDLPPPNLSAENGFFKIFTLVEPPDVDVSSPEIIKKYQTIFDPRKTSKTKLKEWFDSVYLEQIKGMYGKTDAARQMIIKMEDLNEPMDKIIDLKELNVFKKTHGYLLSRYEELISSDIIEDFTNPETDAWPPMILVKELSNASTVNWVFEAFDGKWKNSVNNLLNQITCFQNVFLSSRILYLSFTSNNIIIHSVFALSKIQNHPQCPPEIHRLILNRLKPLRYTDYLIPETTLIGKFHHTILWSRSQRSDFDTPLQKFFFFLILDKRRWEKFTYSLYNDILKDQQAYTKKWENSDIYNRSPGDIYLRGFLLKISFFLPEYLPLDELFSRQKFKEIRYHENEDFIMLIYRNRRRITYLDLLMIQSELYLKLKKPINELLKSLDTYQYLDPYENNHYQWDQGNETLYCQSIPKVSDINTGGPLSRKGWSVDDDKPQYIQLPFHQKNKRNTK